MSEPQNPRSGQEAVAGIPWLARMIDKARLEASGHIEAFDLDYPCPMDTRLLQTLGLDGKTFQTLVLDHQDDAAIVEALQQKGANLSAAKR